jgi:[acyl-carrier-protein] S-malonyltransferase
MPKIAFVFPGQGAQYVGMGKEMAESFPEAAAVFEEADGIAGYSIKDLCFYGPQEKLDQTEYSQPALLTTSIAILKVVDRPEV